MDAGHGMQFTGPVPGTRYRAPDSVSGLRSSALDLDEACGKVVSPSPLIPPWPRAGSRAPRTEPGNAPMGFAYPMCAFSSSRARSSALGVRSSASIRLRCRVPGPRCQIAGTRYRVPGTWHLPSKNPHTGYAGCRIEMGNTVPSCILYPASCILYRAYSMYACFEA